MESFGYTKEDLEHRLAVTAENGEKIQKCLQYALNKLTVYHNEGAKGLIVDDALYDLYAKIEGALKSYESYNSRVTTKINAKLDALKEITPKKSSSIPRRSY